MTSLNWYDNCQPYDSTHGLLTHNPKTDGLSSALQRGTHDAFHQSLLSTLLDKGDIAVDVGANVGSYTVPMAKLVGSAGKVLAIEPDPLNFHLLRANLSKACVNNTTCLMVGASDKVENLPLYRHANNSGDSRTWGKYEPLTRAAETIPAITLDSVVPGVIKLLKIDVQGWEARVLRGAVETLSNDLAFILLEYWPYGLVSSGSSCEELFSLLTSFDIHVIDNRRRTFRKVLPYTNLFEPRTNYVLDLLCTRRSCG